MLTRSFARAKSVLDKNYIHKEIALQEKFFSEVIFCQNHFKKCIERWIWIMALRGVLCVSGLFSHIHYLT